MTSRRRGAVLLVILGLASAAHGPATAVAADGERGRVGTLRGVVEAVRRCWRNPVVFTYFERVEHTIRFSLRRDGSVIGEPRVTFTNMAAGSRARAILEQAATDAVRRCSPLDITPSLGEAIAGRPIAVRLIYNGPKGQGV